MGGQSGIASRIWLLVGLGLVLEASYLFVVGCFTNQETGVAIEGVADNLAFFGPMIELLIGGCFLLALLAAFVISLVNGDISVLLGIILIVPSCSVGIAAVAPYFCQMVAMETVTMGITADMASEGLTVATMAYALGGMSAAMSVGLYYQMMILCTVLFSMLLQLKMFVPPRWW